MHPMKTMDGQDNLVFLFDDIAEVEWYQYGHGSDEERILFLLDPCESDSDWDQVIRFLSWFSKQKKATWDVSCIFLGSQKIYSLENFLHNRTLIRKENKGRISLLAPIIELFQNKHTDSRIFLLYKDVIFDLEDLESHPLTQRTTMIQLHEKIEFHTIFNRHFSDPTLIEIHFPHSLPIYWTNTEYELSMRDRTLKWKGGNDYTVHIGVIKSPRLSKLQIRVYRHNSYQEVYIEPCDPPQIYFDLFHIKMKGINSEEELRDRLRSCIHQKIYQCPHCDNSHSITQLTCPNSRGTSTRNFLKGQALFEWPPSIPTSETGYILLLFNELRAMYYPHPIFPLTHNRIAYRENPGDTPIIWENRTSGWTPTESKLEQFFQWKENVYVLIHW